ALTMSASVTFSSLVALTASAMIASKLLRKQEEPTRLARVVDRFFAAFQRRYKRWVVACLAHPWRIGTLLVGLLVAVVVLIEKIPSEFAPKEDRGAFFIIVNGPEGASFKY